MRLLPHCLRHCRKWCLHGLISWRRPSPPHELHRLHRQGSLLLLNLNVHRHLLFCPQLPCPHCTRPILGVGRSIPRWISCASCYLNHHPTNFPFCRLSLFWCWMLEYLRPGLLLTPPPLLIFVLVSLSKINLKTIKNYLNTCIVRQVVHWDIKCLFLSNMHQKNN